jgi:hypothetical protein
MHLNIPCYLISFIFFMLLTINFSFHWFLPRIPLPPYSSSKPFRLNTKDELQLTIFSDLHFGENEDSFGIEQDIKSIAAMNSILDHESPNLVILNGDLITGENTFLKNSTKYLDQIVAPMVQRNIPWASTYGNHDSQFNLSREALFQADSKYELSFTHHSPPGVPGVSNYYLLVQYHPTNEVLAVLWFFDSRGGFPFQAPPDSQILPDWVESATVSWFLDTSSLLKSKYGEGIPSLAFVHIPPTAFLSAQAGIGGKGEESSVFPGLNDDVPLEAQGNGPDGKDKDVPFLDALVEAGVHSVYSGHDHGDSWCANWPATVGERWKAGKNSRGSEGKQKDRKGPYVCFCKHTGYGGYGTWQRGARVVKLNLDGEMKVDTWVRMKGGKVVQRVELNETYGIDVYPIENGEEG